VNRKSLVLIFFAVLLIPSAIQPLNAGEVFQVAGTRIDSGLFDLGYEWTTGPPQPSQHLVWHLRNRLGFEVWEGSEYLQGIMENTINVDANMKFSDDGSPPKVKGNVWGTASVELDSIEGGWEGSFYFAIKDGFFSFEGVYSAIGTGALEGWSLELHVVQDGLTHSETFSGLVFSPDS